MQWYNAAQCSGTMQWYNAMDQNWTAPDASGHSEGQRSNGGNGGSSGGDTRGRGPHSWARFAAVQRQCGPRFAEEDNVHETRATKKHPPTLEARSRPVPRRAQTQDLTHLRERVAESKDQETPAARPEPYNHITRCDIFAIYVL